MGPRRESVQAERLVYTYMFHKYFGPWPDESTTWEDFVSRNSGSSEYTNGNVILNKNNYRFASWDTKNMGLVIPDSNNYLESGFVNFPYQKSLTGAFTVENKVTEGMMADGSTVNLTNAECFYTSDDSTVAKVDEYGMITPVSKGTANVWVYVKHNDYWVGNSVQISVVN